MELMQLTDLVGSEF